MINIVIAEDQILLRDALTNILNGQDDMRVVGYTENADNALALCREHAPDLALIDVVTDNKANGITATAQIRRDLPKVKIVIMTALPEITFVDAARKAGAHSFVYKDVDIRHLLRVIRSTAEGHGVYPGPVNDVLTKDRFSEEEIKVIRLFCQGKDREEIAALMSMSESSVKAIFASVRNKTGYENITKFSMYAIAHGLIVPDHDA